MPPQSSGIGGADQRSTFPAGPVTGTSAAEGAAWPEPADVAPAPVPVEPRLPTGRKAWFWYGGTAGLVLIVGLVIVLVTFLNGNLGSGEGPFSPRAEAPTDVRPPLARLCPAPTNPTEPSPPTGGGQPATGPRTVDEKAGISYRAYGAPWEPWSMVWRMGTLEVPYGVGQFFVTETYWQGEYLASILSAAVPATVNDSTAIDIECTGRQVAADVRAEYYPQPNTMEVFRDELTTLGGRPAWVTKFRLHFDEEGLKAKDELVAVAVIDVGRPTAAVLYVSVPGTHREWDHVVDEVLASVATL